MTDPATWAATQRFWAKRRDLGRRHVQFVDGLVADFDIPDRGVLEMALAIAEVSYDRETLLGPGGEWSGREANALDKLVPALRKTVDLMRELRRPLARELAGARDGEKETHPEIAARNELWELSSQLALVGCAAAKAPRRRRGVGEHDSGYNAVRTLVAVLVCYWKYELGRKFTQDHKAWSKDRDGRLMPTKGKSLQFVFRVVEHIAPGDGGTLKTIAREFTGKWSLK